MNERYKNSNKPTKKSRYKQGYYAPVNIKKYIGNPANIIYRSTYEYKFCRYCDYNEIIVNWSSEPFGIAYISPVDNRKHTYNIDFFMTAEQNGKTTTYLVEVKPKSKLIRPTMSGKQTLKRLKAYNSACEEFLVNKAKKEAAEAYAKTMGHTYIIVTEDFLSKVSTTKKPKNK